MSFALKYTMIRILVCILSVASLGAKADTLPERIDKFVNLFKTSEAAVNLRCTRFAI